MSEIVERLAKIIINPEDPVDRFLHEVLEVIVYGGAGYVLRMVTED